MASCDLRGVSNGLSGAGSPACLGNCYETSFTSGGFHVPSSSDGGFSWGQYSRIIRTNSSAGAGSQFDSLSLPGESFWTYRSIDPSALALNLLRELTV